jgi:hypothetical protein
MLGLQLVCHIRLVISDTIHAEGTMDSGLSLCSNCTWFEQTAYRGVPLVHYLQARIKQLKLARQ